MWTRISAWLLVLSLTGVPCSAPTQEARPEGLDSRSLTEVRWLTELPPGLAAAVGREKSGLDGIADVQGTFNSTDAIDNRLPLRRFIVGGLSPKSAVIAYEQGGSDYKVHPYHAKAYILEELGWRQTGEWTLRGNPLTLIGLILQLRSVAEPSAIDGLIRLSKLSERIATSHPARRDSPLREANLSDEEVREIQAVAHGVVSDSLVNISGVVTGCPCEEGANCSDQVWIVAYSPMRTKGLQLSKIGGRWAIGPVQQWWLDLENIDSRETSFVSRTAYFAEREKLYARFPVCPSDHGLSAAAKGALTVSDKH